MTAIEWFNALQWIHVVLIVTILLLFTGYIYLLRKITQLRYVGGLIGKWKIRIFGILFGSLVVFYLFYNLHNLQPNEWVEISLLVGLVAATSALALYAAGQADASVEMAEEMKAQRYDAVRPVIDIQRRGGDKIREGLAAETEEYSYGLSCILHNIGLGPATDIYSFVQNPFSDERQCFEFGTLAAGGKAEEMRLSLEQEDNRTALVVYHKDVYGRAFESSREVQAGKKREGWKVGPLRIRSIVEGEDQND